MGNCGTKEEEEPNDLALHNKGSPHGGNGNHNHHKNENQRDKKAKRDIVEVDSYDVSPRIRSLDQQLTK